MLNVCFFAHFATATTCVALIHSSPLGQSLFVVVASSCVLCLVLAPVSFPSASFCRRVQSIAFVDTCLAFRRCGDSSNRAATVFLPCRRCRRRRRHHHRGGGGGGDSIGTERAVCVCVCVRIVVHFLPHCEPETTRTSPLRSRTSWIEALGCHSAWTIAK